MSFLLLNKSDCMKPNKSQIPLYPAQPYVSIWWMVTCKEMWWSLKDFLSLYTWILLEIVYHLWIRKLSQKSTYRHLPKDRKAYDGKAEALTGIFNCKCYLHSNPNTILPRFPQPKQVLSSKDGDPAILLLSIDAKKLKAESWRDICIPTFTVALFILAKR